MKKAFIFVFVFILMISFISCGQKNTDLNTDEKPVVQEIKGKQIETDFMTITLLAGWTNMDLANGVQIYKGTEALQITIEGYGLTDNDARAFVQTAVDSYGGDEISEISMWGMDFYMTKYEYAGTFQASRATLFDGDKLLVVKTNTKTADISDDIQKMIDSVKLK